MRNERKKPYERELESLCSIYQRKEGKRKKKWHGMHALSNAEIVTSSGSAGPASGPLNTPFCLGPPSHPPPCSIAVHGAAFLHAALHDALWKQDVRGTRLLVYDSGRFSP